MPKGERRVIELSYAPTAPEQLGGHRIKCQVCPLRQEQSRVDFCTMCPDQMLHAHTHTHVGSSIHPLLSPAHACICSEQVINGSTYVLALSGAGYKPKLNLSFLSYEFGPRHVFQQGMTAAVAKLLITNEDRQPVSFDAVFDNNENWQVCPPGCLCRASVRAACSGARASAALESVVCTQSVRCRWPATPPCCSQATTLSSA